jgi:hypothetical protein
MLSDELGNCRIVGFRYRPDPVRKVLDGTHDLLVAGKQLMDQLHARHGILPSHHGAMLRGVVLCTGSGTGEHDTDPGEYREELASHADSLIVRFVGGRRAAVLSHGATLIQDNGTTLIPQGPKSQ